MKTRIHTINFKPGCKMSGTNDDAHYVTNGFGKGGTIARGVVYVSYFTSTDQDGIYGPAGRAHFLKIKSPSIAFTDVQLRCDDSVTAPTPININDNTISVCENQSYETSGNNTHFHYQNLQATRDGTHGKEFMNFNTANPINIKVTDISDDAVAVPDYRLGLTFVEFLDDEE